VRPRYFVPLHGENRHLVKHRRLAIECGVDEDDAHIIEDGQPFTLTPDGFSLEEPVLAESIMVDGKGVGDVGQSLLMERRILGDEGMVVATVVLSGETWEILQGPELFSKGFVFEQQYSHILEEAAKMAGEIVATSAPGDEARLKDRLRASLRRFFRKSLDRDPVLVPIVTIV
jgi:ribonuclease J